MANAIHFIDLSPEGVRNFVICLGPYLPNSIAGYLFPVFMLIGFVAFVIAMFSILGKNSRRPKNDQEAKEMVEDAGLAFVIGWITSVLTVIAMISWHSLAVSRPGDMADYKLYAAASIWEVFFLVTFIAFTFAIKTRSVATMCVVEKHGHA
ncbi:MAG: hypothetical protein JWN37_582 [Candidatus Nomurabacteria bacterium]|nr:hypothetical protein [Candidatus Nomurabacteria bacterium]